jgi:hypothetical protein
MARRVKAIKVLQYERRDGTQSKSYKGRSIDHSRNFCPHQSEEQDDGGMSGLKEGAAGAGAK